VRYFYFLLQPANAQLFLYSLHHNNLFV